MIPIPPLRFQDRTATRNRQVRFGGPRFVVAAWRAQRPDATKRVPPDSAPHGIAPCSPEREQTPVPTRRMANSRRASTSYLTITGDGNGRPARPPPKNAITPGQDRVAQASRPADAGTRKMPVPPDAARRFLCSNHSSLGQPSRPVVRFRHAPAFRVPGGRQRRSAPAPTSRSRAFLSSVTAQSAGRTRRGSWSSQALDGRP